MRCGHKLLLLLSKCIGAIVREQISSEMAGAIDNELGFVESRCCSDVDKECLLQNLTEIAK